MTEISPSILASDLSSLASELSTVETADRLHVDVMDGHFVPNIALGFPLVESIRACTSLPVDVHLMIANPIGYVDRIASLPVESATIHVEATDDVRAVAGALRDAGISPGVAINPGTDGAALDGCLEHVDRLTVMGVEPGFSGQEFQRSALERVERFDGRFPGDIEIDGGITAATARESAAAGADIVVSGSTVFDSQNRREMIETLRGVTD